MPNPILPTWEYIPDGEPRVFGDRVYLYGSHDRVGDDMFCDYKLKVWSAPLNDLNHWTCHGESFHTLDNDDHKTEVDWTDHELYAPDVVEKDGKYYLFAYILFSKGCVGVSDHPEGPFKLISTYKYNEEDGGDEGIYNDPGVLVDDDGRMYIYYGYEKSHMNELDPKDPSHVLPGTLIHDVIQPGMEDMDFFEASSPRKINGRYYLIYSPRRGSRLAYAISDSPTGPFKRMGYIIDNAIDYPAGNNHGSVMNVNGQWYVFYHRMTNGTLTSRRACVEPITILEDGTIPPVEMTSLGFDRSLNPYEITDADRCCVLKNSGVVTEKDEFTRLVSNVRTGSIIGYKYFDFGDDFTTGKTEVLFKVNGLGCRSLVHVLLDDYENGKEVGVLNVGMHDGIYRTKLENITGRHAVYFKVEADYEGWYKDAFTDRNLFDFISFVFKK